MALTDLLQGTQVRLTACTSGDVPVIAGWYQNPGFLRLFDARPAAPHSEASVGEWLEETQKSATAYVFAIRPLETDQIIGFVELEGILWSHGTAWLGMAIGDPEQQGRGYGSEALRLALAFAFQELNLHRIQLTVFSYNDRAIALYEKLGFQREGCHREMLLRDGRRHDMYLYGLLRQEWQANPSQP